MSDKVDIVVNEPHILILLEQKLLKKGYKRKALRETKEKAIIDYIDDLVMNQKRSFKISPRLQNIEKDIEKDTIKIPKEYYIKLDKHVKKMPYKFNDIIVYVICFHYKKLLRELDHIF